jgi:colicin import membrane protein
MAEPVRKMPADREPEPPPSDDPFRYGWRWRRVRLPSGEVVDQEIPLTVEDLLDPEEGDQVTQSGPHGEWFVRLGYLLKRYYESRDDVLVCADMKMLWGIPGLKRPSPDIAIVQGIRDKGAVRYSFDVLKEGVRPSLIIELVSPQDDEVRANDYVKKVEIYQRAGIPEYFILEPPNHFTQDRLLITPYRLGSDGRYRRVEPDAQGRFLSETTGLLFGVESDGKTLSLIDIRTGESPLDLPEERARRAEEQARRDAEARAAREAEARVREAEAREAAEAKLARLRAELERLKKP